MTEPSEICSLRDKYEKMGTLALDPNFELIKAGRLQAPSHPPRPAAAFISQDPELARYATLFCNNMGPFGKHFFASIPFLLEEQIRFGFALARWRKQRTIDAPLLVYESESQDGTATRTLAAYSEGSVLTITNGVHQVSEDVFRSLCTHPWSKFYLGYFVDITPEMLRSHPDFVDFSGGFDVVYENLTFQFYDDDRTAQIKHLKSLMRPGGLLFCAEKVLHPDQDEYLRRESLKDTRFKSIYFSGEEVEWKRSEILTQMRFEVTLDTLVDALASQFEHIFLVWNAANFYELAACDSKANLDSLFDCLVTPYVPPEFSFEEKLRVPKRLK